MKPLGHWVSRRWPPGKEWRPCPRWHRWFNALLGCKAFDSLVLSGQSRGARVSPEVSALIDAAGALCRRVVSAAMERDDCISDQEAEAIANLRHQIKRVLDADGGFMGMTVTPLPTRRDK